MENKRGKCEIKRRKQRKENKDRDKIRTEFSEIIRARKEEDNQQTTMSQESTNKGIFVPKPEFLPFSVIIQSGCTTKADFGPFSVHKIAIPPYRYYIIFRYMYTNQCLS